MNNNIKYFVLIAFCLINLSELWSQCNCNSVSLNKPEKLTEFVNKYSNCPEMFGNIKISGSSISSLSDLKFLKKNNWRIRDKVYKQTENPGRIEQPGNYNW